MKMQIYSLSEKGNENVLSRIPQRLLTSVALVACLNTPALAGSCLQQVQAFALEHQLELSSPAASDAVTGDTLVAPASPLRGDTPPRRQWASDPLLVEPGTHSIYDTTSVPGTRPRADSLDTGSATARKRIETDIIEALLTGARDDGLRGDEPGCLARLAQARETLEVYR